MTWSSRYYNLSANTDLPGALSPITGLPFCQNILLTHVPATHGIHHIITPVTQIKWLHCEAGENYHNSPQHYTSIRNTIKHSATQPTINPYWTTHALTLWILHSWTQDHPGQPISQLTMKHYAIYWSPRPCKKEYHVKTHNTCLLPHISQALSPCTHPFLTATVLSPKVANTKGPGIAFAPTTLTYPHPQDHLQQQSQNKAQPNHQCLAVFQGLNIAVPTSLS